MTIRVMFPAGRWREDLHIEVDSVGKDIEPVFCTGLEQVTDEQWRACDGLVSAPDPVPPEKMHLLERCRILVTPKVGFDNIDLAKWGAAGIPVCNVPDYGTQEVADHALALVLTIMKSINFHSERLRADVRGNWKPALNPFGKRLSVCTFGIVGLGRIGTATALRAKAFNMDVVFYDPYKSNGSDLALGIRRADSLPELMAQCDIVSVHVPLGDETRKLIGQAALAAVKPGLVLVNTARGEVVDLDALYDAMRDNRVLAAGLDVLPEEPANPQARLIAAWTANEPWIKDRVLLTPHSAFFTPQSVYDMRFKGGWVAARYLREGRLENCVNQHLLLHRR